MNKALRRPFLLCIGISGLLASAFMYGIMSRGAGVSPDSAVYIDTATHLLAGKGFYSNARPMTHFPPFYPLLLAAASTPGGNVIRSARLLNAFFFGVNAVLMAVAVYLCTGRSAAAALCAFFWFVTSVAMLDIHSMAWSEPTFLGLSLATFLLLSKYIVSPRFGLLAGAGMLLGLAIVTRFVGVALLPPAVICLLFLGHRPIRRRIRDSVIACAMGCAPLAIRLIFNIAAGQPATGRTFALHPVSGSQIAALVVTVHDLFLPVTYSGRIKALSLGLLMGLFIVAVGPSLRSAVRDRRDPELAAVFQFLGVLFCLTYVALLLISVSVFDASTPFDGRMLSPVFVFSALMIVTLCRNAARNRPFVWSGFLIFWVLSVTMNLAEAVPMAARIREEGRGFTTATWTESDTIRFVQSLPGRAILYSNGADVIHFLTGRDVASIPSRVSSVTLRRNSMFDEEMTSMCGALAQPGSALVYLRNVDWRWYLSTAEEARSACGLSMVTRLADGAVYRKPRE